jgi:hypothetical protein
MPKPIFNQEYLGSIEVMIMVQECIQASVYGNGQTIVIQIQIRSTIKMTIMKR